MILSTGRSTMIEVEDAVDTILKNGCKKLAILHCVSDYPASFKSLNLRAMNTLKETFNLPVGFSDHSLGIEASVAAVALGAKIIEKHITLDRNLEGPDHKASLEPKELKSMVSAIRNVEMAMGDGVKKPDRSELWGLKNSRKSIIAKVDISSGTQIVREMLAIKRPGNGIEPKYFDQVIGKFSMKKIKKDSSLNWGMIRR